VATIAQLKDVQPMCEEFTEVVYDTVGCAKQCSWITKISDFPIRQLASLDTQARLPPQTWQEHQPSLYFPQHPKQQNNLNSHSFLITTKILHKALSIYTNQHIMTESYVS
jgi:hypothetical protein